MIAEFIITFRETLEAALIVGIILAYLYKIGQKKYYKQVWLGVGIGITASIIAAVLFTFIAGGFTGKIEEIFEGITMLLAAGLISTMIFWMAKHKKKIRKQIESKVSVAIENKEKTELLLLPMIAVLREGVETVIFLSAATFASGKSIMHSSVGAVSGIVLALGVGYVFFAGAKKIDLRHFFTATSVILILFAAGLTAHGVHEFQEAGILPVVIEHVYDVNHIIDENSSFGSFLKSLLGYNGNPSLLEVMAYFAYLAGIWLFVRKQKVQG